MIAIIDYGMGNLRSVQKGFEKAGWPAAVVDRPEQLADARGVVLPGVGAFNDAMTRLRESGLDRAVHRVVEAGKPLLGICLGFQLFFEYSEEWGPTRGLGIFPGRVRRLTGGVKIPHMGWNQVRLLKPGPLTAGIPDQSDFYFVHSYYVDPADKALVTGVTSYGIEFTSMAERDNVFGIQFHPEKSSVLGLKILHNFGGLAAKC
ncbi:imidazole glycerol phosphate synthase subunit HisH [Desulfotomaculum copahuensis]|uniref:Imidazole glycerol phosphate synthase subunit HisH n=1 Tax=Desulfotomaculum copahuensis TaxID=1838280 RepID=A0A1B7LH45_9FIRM|nr:imidazole glycerol phosphate synthase subunit HisH [Desulfotomaculum copahuensis]OAT85534.1 imidazole glycerol phosphate synthase, glutamine amidotransferase subunit [Desulfotomaculum copahuensis]